MPDAHNCSAETGVADGRAPPYLQPAGGRAGELEIRTVKIVLSVAALVGSVSLLAIDWAGRAFAYL